MLPFCIRLFIAHIRSETLMLLLQQLTSEVFSELKKDAVVALELILKSSSIDFVAVRKLLPLMSDYQLDLLNDEVRAFISIVRRVVYMCHGACLLGYV